MRIFVATVAVPAVRRFDHPRTEKLPATIPMLRLVVAFPPNRFLGSPPLVPAASRAELRLAPPLAERLENSSDVNSLGAPEATPPAPLPMTPPRALQPPGIASSHTLQRTGQAYGDRSQGGRGRPAPYHVGYAAPGTVSSVGGGNPVGADQQRVPTKPRTYSNASAGRRTTPVVARLGDDAVGQQADFSRTSSQVNQLHVQHGTCEHSVVAAC